MIDGANKLVSTLLLFHKTIARNCNIVGYRNEVL
jgi:hypothetical protein